MPSNKEKLIALRTGQVQARRSGDYWSKEELEEMVQMFVGGMGLSDIALHFDRNEVSIYQQLSKSGLLSAQCRPRNRCAKRIDGPQGLCPACAVANCENCGKECAYAGNV